jgi:hypothetical protein
MEGENMRGYIAGVAQDVAVGFAVTVLTVIGIYGAYRWVWMIFQPIPAWVVSGLLALFLLWLVGLGARALVRMLEEE